MATDHISPTTDDGANNHSPPITEAFAFNDLASLVPLVAATAVIINGADWAWPAATILLGMAYLMAFLGR